MAKWGNIPMNIPTMMNVVTTQRRRYCTIIQMNEFCNINALMVQRRRYYSFNSPGLARERAGDPGL